VIKNHYYFITIL